MRARLRYRYGKKDADGRAAPVAKAAKSARATWSGTRDPDNRKRPLQIFTNDRQKTLDCLA
eukprot:8043834-Pyramimonas_sp.AAC.1